MRLAIIALLGVLLSGCSNFPERNERVPEAGVESRAGVGDPIYTYINVPAGFNNYYDGTTTYTGAGQGVRQEILYSGMSSGELNFDYREFVNDFARPSFSQQAKYTYEEGGQVVFKGATIEVIRADNQAMIYVVKKGFNDEKAAN